MRKKTFLAIAVSMAVFLTGIPELGQAEEMTDDLQLTEVQDEIGSASQFGYRPIEKTILNKGDLESGRSKMSMSRLAELPSAYDAREEGMVTAIKDQGKIGNCWAHAAIGASESNVLQKGLETSPDLSEYHLSYSAYNKALDPLGLTEEDTFRVKEMSNDVYSWGGNDYLAVSALARWQGEVSEDTASMDDLKQSVADGKTAVLADDIMYAADRYHLQNAEFIYLSEENRDLIKRKLMQYGAASVSIHAPETTTETRKYGNTGKSDFTSYFCNDTSLQTNHSVLIVGWDDDYAVSNFNSQCQPANPGAWLIRNSWGANNEMGGYFWLSYEDAMLQIENNESAEVTFYDVEPADNYDYNYQYDGGIPFSYIRGYHSIANVYTAQTNEKLQAVSFYTQEKNVNYSISVYNMSEPSNPISGTKLGETLTGTMDERGYHTVDFTDVGGEDIYLSEGELFSVVLRLTNSSGENVYYTYESTGGYSVLNTKVSAGAGESFVSSGNTWIDLGKKKNANLCLKAFTAEAEGNMPTPTPTTTPTAVPTVTPTTTPTAVPTVTSTAVQTAVPTVTSTAVPTATATVDVTNQPTATATVSPSVKATPTPKVTSSTAVTTTKKPVTPEPTQATANPPLPKVLPTSQPIVRKLSFKPASKSVKVGKKLKLGKYLKVTKDRSGTPKIVYEFTKKKYKKYASLSSAGVLKAKKAGRKKVLYIRARAKDGSGKTAKIKVKIK